MRFSGLYAIADHDTCLAGGLDPSEVAVAMCSAGVACVQLRAKSLADEPFLRWIEAVLDRCPTGSPIVINDRVDLALMTGAAAVHLGQGDLPLEEVRRLDAELTIGLSTHDLGQLELGALTKPDYLAFGPIFPTISKRNAEPSTGLARLQDAHERALEHRIPVVAIGGLSDANLDQVLPHCEMVAAIGLLMPPRGGSRPYSWIEQRCADFHARALEQRC